jgi:hypothetical protein
MINISSPTAIEPTNNPQRSFDGRKRVLSRSARGRAADARERHTVLLDELRAQYQSARESTQAHANVESGDHAAVAIRRHSSEQTRHAWAQAWQCACGWRAHSPPQASHTSAHKRHRSRACKLSRDMYEAARRQIAAQSMSRRTHSTIILTSSSLRQALAQ